MTDTPSRILSLNTTINYLEHWTDERAVTEIIANAFDADPSALTIEAPASNELVVNTPSTHPTIQQLTSFGASTKTNDGTTIGQFGEGAKCAFHVLTRNHGPDAVTVHVPGYTATFCFKQPYPDFDPVLHMLLWSTPSNPPGCSITIRGIDARSCIEARFILPPDNLTQILHLKPSPSPLRVYYRGIFCADQLQCVSLFNWNVQKAKMSRDRNIVDLAALYTEAVEALSSVITDDIADRLVAFSHSSYGNPITLAEIIALYNRTYLPSAHPILSSLTSAIHRTFGAKVCIQTSPIAEARARDSGYSVLSPDLTDNFLLMCLKARNPSTSLPYLLSDYMVAPEPPTLRPNPVPPTPAQSATLTRYSSLLSRIFPSGSRIPNLHLCAPLPSSSRTPFIYDTASLPPSLFIDASTVGSSLSTSLFAKMVRTIIQHPPFDKDTPSETILSYLLSDILIPPSKE